MNIEALKLLQATLRRTRDQNKYEEARETLRKTIKSNYERVDRRIFNKGRPKGSKNKPKEPKEPKKISPEPQKKYNVIEKYASTILQGYARAKIDANTLQPAIFTELVGKEVNQMLDEGKNKKEIIKILTKEPKKRAKKQAKK